ncbi:MAG: sulfotransferase [Hydrococcus sp. C42_A2020_068]|uniref:sulfotransferase family protein n=1 Tax=Pleurocapsa sp. PCC 7327 TaxID=118163 RepID=UPI00029F88BC|nr:sulfotransferase [Pleurocapsa sp. PCC 7327]AFY76732.1 sulfotransferase family protein [Pleurocapsa sp. PCC 7327]MBF2020955.1 sulfotransferase [Hydrococcus sp. C42_A2020_068]
MTLPNFLIIGAAKAGTTALHTYLQQHPQIYMTPDKETNFFAFEGEHLNFQGPGDEAINQFSIIELESYQAEFQNVSDEKAIGEACPLYLYHAKAPERIYSYIPHVRLIAILRHPVDRAYANFLHIIRDDREPCRDFAQALQQEKKRIEDNWEWFWHYIQLGYYSIQLKRYYDIFDREQIRVYLYEDLCQNPLALIQDIFCFLGVDKTFVPDISIRPNKSGIPKNLLVHKLLTKPNPIKSILKPLFPSQLRQKIQHQNLKTPKISSETKVFLTNLYREDILKCQDLIDRDLSGWLN